MENKKLAFIYGKDKFECGIEEGKIEEIGDIQDDIRHTIVLLDFAHEKYSDVPIFQKLTTRQIPEVVSFFYAKLFNHIVFLNTTSFKKDGVLGKHGKKGTFILPNNISDVQKEGLYKFLDEIDDYKVAILYDLDIVDGLLDGKEIASISGESPNELFDKYFNKMEKSKTL